MTIYFINRMLFVVFRYSTLDRDGLGFVIKLEADRTFSEERGYYQGFVLGPLYARTFSWWASVKRRLA